MNRFSVIAVALLILITLAGCGSTAKNDQAEEQVLSQERVDEIHGLSVQLTGYLAVGDIASASAMLDDTMKKAMDGKLADTWSELVKSLGAFIETGGYTGTVDQGYDILEMTLAFEQGTLIQRTVYGRDNLIAGLFFRNGKIEDLTGAALPEGVSEVDVTVDSGEGYPLPGKLTLPKDAKPRAAVILIHGSGPNNMDEAVGANAPFCDLAYGLAAKGIAVLRYDKRTLIHGAAMVASHGASGITIDEEVAFDALAAVKLLRQREEISGCKVYLLGHSLGGGLLSYINSLGAGCDGYIIMAGTPRNMWELSAEQNLLLAGDLEQSGDAAKAEEARQFVASEQQRASALAEMKDGDTLFGIPAVYLQKLEQIDAIALHLKDGLPVLVLQGEKDRQVTMKDFALWQAALAGSPAATFISYPGLNHLFGAYEGDPAPFAQLVEVEYSQDTPVPDEVIKDIADWLNRAARL
jgi:fermentation-respiration switch protein FrsA (DUF1100 family)